MHLKTYKNHRELLNTGDLVAFSTRDLSGLNKFIPSVIEYMTQSNFYHVGLVWKASERVFMIDAIDPKIRIYPLSKKENFYHIPMNIEWDNEWDEFLLNKVGENYSYLEAIASYLSTPKDDKKWVCSELVSRVYKKIGVGDDFGFTPRSNIEKALKLSKAGMYKVISAG